MLLNFTKMQGLGNDFVVVDATARPFQPDAALLQRLTDRHFGVGCDQVLVIDPPPAADVDFGYRIYNSDGSESGQCLNGSRCVARFVRERGLSQKAHVRLRTQTSVLELEQFDDGRVRVNTGVPRFEPKSVPLVGHARNKVYSIELPDGSQISCGAVSMGNPHAVILVDDVDSAPVAEIGAALQHHPAFPQRVNVGFLQIIDSAHARLRVYERGAGETLACGSGACAAMAVGRLWERLGARVEMSLRGGKLNLEWSGTESELWMTGPAETVFEGSIEWPK
ncbi:MAG: diaminopimelate epimerase [Nevskia sp.]|nr:diaminopimelate epimerase [Nevskia sp.]